MTSAGDPASGGRGAGGWLQRLKLDPFLAVLVTTVIIASLLPVRGSAAEGLSAVSKIMIAVLFFLHGARLPRTAVVAAIAHWRLQGLVVATTFGLFPVLGVAAALLTRPFLPEPLPSGFVFLGCLPSTVQSSIAFTSAARGNVAAAVTSASLSNVIGMLLTPLLVAILLGAQGGGLSVEAMEGIFLQLLAPFLAGQLLRGRIGGWVDQRKRLLTLFDRGTIAVIVYLAFSAAVVGGLWGRMSSAQLAAVLVVCMMILAIVLTATTAISRRLRFEKADEIAIVFCGSKKTLTGVAMAGILFPPETAAVIVLPLMIFHQLQLIVCAYLASRYGRRELDYTSGQLQRSALYR